MQRKILNNICNNKYLYSAILVICVIVSLVFSFVYGDGTYVGKSSIYDESKSEIVNINVYTKDEESNREILNKISNESITEIHNVLGTNVNNETSIKKNINIFSAIIRGLIIGLLLCIIKGSNVLVKKEKVKSEDISEIFDGVPVLAKISKNKDKNL